ncbi:MAG: uroporphyrinogen-III C-methyltransferase [Oscillospiraceae bacterium]
MSTKGKVYLIGAGCGDWQLITLKGLNRLKTCDCVIYDRLISKKLLEYVPEMCKKIYVGKQCGYHSKTQDEINQIIVDEALSGKNVARLKGGDPFVFGRGGEEIQELQKQGIEYEVISGISSSIAVPSNVGIPVTHRNVARSFHVITGHTMDNSTEDFSTLAKLKGTLIFLMSLGNLKTICNGLISNGKDKITPCAIICNGTMPNEKVIKGDLSTIVDIANQQDIQPPSILVVGETVKFNFKSTIEKPLDGKSIGITGTDRFTSQLEDKLYNLGGSVSKLNYMSINPLYENISSIDFSKYTHIVFTSPNGVDIFFKYLKSNHIDIRTILNKKFATVGTSTAESLSQYGIYADIIPKKFTSMELAKTIVEQYTINDNYLILRGVNGSNVLTNILKENDIKYNDIKIYDISCDNAKLSQDVSALDYIIFGSSMGVKEFFKYKTLSPDTKIIAIGELCKSTLDSFNLDNKIYMADTYNIDGIINKMLSI